MKLTRMGDTRNSNGVNGGNLTPEQVVLSVLFGNKFKYPQKYDPDKTYSEGDLITYTNTDGSDVVMYATKSGISGTFVASDWSQCNLLKDEKELESQIGDSVSNSYNNLLISVLMDL